jgi:cis-3-alkyl-4-acyloxetan-2-one decarboxylase
VIALHNRCLLTQDRSSEKRPGIISLRLELRALRERGAAIPHSHKSFRLVEVSGGKLHLEGEVTFSFGLAWTLNAELPESRFFVQPSGLRQAFIDVGVGETVVMVHGNPTWSYYYRQVIAALSPRYRCIAPDHIGCGRSDKPMATQYDFQLRSRIDDLERLLDHAKIEGKITLLMQDWGGMIGLSYAARHPERIARIIATNTGCGPLPRGKRFPRSIALGRNTRLGAWLILQQNAFCRLAARWCVRRRPLPADVRAKYLEPYDTPAHRLAVLKFVQTIPLSEQDVGWDIVTGTQASLKQFAHVPTLLLWGLQDFVFDRHFLEDFQTHLPHAETHTWPDCGHYLLEDAPDEALAKITEFFGRTRS